MLDFSVAPYWDDTNAPGGAIDQNYLRILFRPGYSVQARELTAIQSLLQNQISNLGSFVLQDGSPVSGGHISIDNTVVALQLQPQFANVDIDITNFFVNGNNTLIINASGATTVKAYVVAIDTTQTNPVIVVKYLTGTQFTPGAIIQVATGVQSQAALATSNASSLASVGSINQGVFYSGGFFIDVAPQTILLTSANNVPTYRVGLTIDESIVDQVSDTNLLDPAQGSFNYQAPGATRYQYNLILDKRDLSSIDDSAFYELLRVENGLITKYIDYPIYATLGSTMAQRTYDQSGDFITKPFIVTVQPNTANTSQFNMTVSPGKAYVKGYEFKTISVQKLSGDRALSTNTANNYAFSLEYGNIVTVNNLYSGNSTGIFDTTNFQQVDLHVVPSANILSSNANSYTGTKIGTAGIRDIEYLGLGDYYIYLTNINLTQNTFNAITGGTTYVTFPRNVTQFWASNLINAYMNVIITVNTAGIIDTRTINNYVGTSNTANVYPPLTTAPTSASLVTLNYGIKDVESLVIAPNTTGVYYNANCYYTQNTALANGGLASMDVAAAGKDITGNTILSDSQFNTLIYELPQGYITQNGFSGATFYARKNLWSQVFTVATGNAQLIITSGSGLGTGESFPYGFSGALTSTVANSNILVVVRANGASGLANGQVIQWNTLNTVIQASNTSITLNVNVAAGFTADVLFTVLETNAQQAAVARRTKTLNGNTSNTTFRTTDSLLNGTAVIGTANANAFYVDAANGFIWANNYYDQALTPGANQSLYIPDVYQIIKIYSSTSPLYAANSQNTLIDVTNNYYLNSGQNDNYYDHSTLILKSGVGPPPGQTAVILQYFSHDTVQGFFDANSYSTSLYQTEAIPYYASQVFGTYTLRDCIDFRPTRQLGSIANVQLLTLYGLKTPNPNYTMVLSYQFYLPRIDKLLLNKTGIFTIKQGIPSQYPATPIDSDDAMTLYIINIPAYTANISAIALQYVENKVYTMKDIGTLDTRIQNLELSSALSIQEEQITSQKILYQDNVTVKNPYGIITDDFSSFIVTDTTSTDLQCYLQKGTLSPMKSQSPIELNLIGSSGALNINDKTYSLAYVETPVIVQNTASEYVSVQPYLFAQFTGTIRLTPTSDFWFSSKLMPQIIAPASSIINLPLTVAPPSAIDLVPINTAPIAPIISGQLVQANASIVTSLYYTGITLGQLEYYNKTLAAFGFISSVSNWFGIPVQTANVSQTILLNNLGTSIQLQPGVGGSSSLNNTVIKVL